MFNFKWKNRISGEIKDISDYVTTCNWSGDVDQAARKIDFSIAYTLKDKGFINQNIIVGDTIYMYFTDETIQGAQQVEIFRGIVFVRNRNTTNFTFEYTAYDRLIYLAKSKTTRKFSNITVESVIEQVANDNNIEIGSVCSIGIYVKFIADNMSYTEILKKAFNYATAQTGKQYHFYLNQDKLYVVEQSQIIENYTASDVVNVQSSQHSESIEDMINTIIIVDSNGNQQNSVSNASDLEAYGKIQEVYKIDKKQDTQTAAKAMLKSVEFKSSLNVLGNIQCIAGYAITVQEEQLKGIFTIKSDKHTISNGVHTMALDIEFLSTVQQQNTTNNTGSGSMNVGEGLQSGSDAWLGSTMNNGTNGCVEAVGKVGSYYSPFLANESNNGVAGVSQLVNDAGDNVISFDDSQLQKGDTIIYGNNDHAVIYDGNGGYIGNSSSQDCIVHGGDYNEMGGLAPTKIIKTSQY
ncbi:hypothetical protein [Pectinatus frisingensis]|uniref:XkdQ/YqbQ family protein n=1 Tax=Pectinatus frisingensis TaxID=865 RepID=UPI0018C8095D|nr:hypothetical protein [Pectinatus frisingensis]